MSQLMHQQALAIAIEFIVNKVLALNVNGVQALEHLEEKTLTIKLAELGFVLSFTVRHYKVLLTCNDEHSDCTITTSLKTLAKLKQQQPLTELIKQDQLDVIGDIKVAQQFAAIAETLDIDWQTELANYIGDIPTYKLTQLGRFLADKFAFAAEQIKADSSEYLVHEKRLVVTSSQIKEFNLQVNQVAKELETLEQRIAQLEIARQVNK